VYKDRPLDDTIAVRADEQIDVAKVTHYLYGKLPGADDSLRVRQFGGGAANLTYLLRYDEQEYVLRRPPLGRVAKSAHDMGREFRVLSVLHAALPEAPRAYLYCEDPGIVGAPFFVMERRRGIVVRRSMPASIEFFPDAAQKISQALVDTLARFHAVDYQSIGLGQLGKPAGFVKRQVEGWYRRWQAAKATDLEEMDLVYDWLRSNLPETREFSLVHNDYKLDNVMLSDQDPGKIVAVFDWDMCTLGDPLSDLGALLAYWTEPTDPTYFQATARMPLGVPGFFSRSELVERYALVSGRSVRDIKYYHALSLFRLAVIIAQIYIRYVRGQTQDHRFAAFEQVIPSTARAAYETALG
jgi:aminoglycoside phosphotransferase (APT) family kinase protein